VPSPALIPRRRRHLLLPPPSRGRDRAARGIGLDFQLLPTELADSDLLAGLGPEQVAEVLVEAFYGGENDADQGDRSMITDIMEETCRVLAPGGLSMPRVEEGLRALMNGPARSGILTEEVRYQLSHDIVSSDYRREEFWKLRPLASLVRSLGRLGSQPRPPATVPLRCIVMSTQWRSADPNFLMELIASWAERRIVSGERQIATLVIAGADELTVRHIERLSDLCQWHDVRLVTMFRHLQDTSAGLIGAGPLVGFMRLGNHEEAARAAEYIGKERRFELSQRTLSVDGDQSHSTSESRGASRGDSRTESRQSGGSQPSTGPSTATWGISDSRARSTDRCWGNIIGESGGKSWELTHAHQRTENYKVEPGILQQLPDYAMVLVEQDHLGNDVWAVDVNPAIAELRPAIGVIRPQDTGKASAGASPLKDHESVVIPTTPTLDKEDEISQAEVDRRARDLLSALAEDPVKALPSAIFPRSIFPSRIKASLFLLSLSLCMLTRTTSSLFAKLLPV
jgi:hypothetical protein